MNLANVSPAVPDRVVDLELARARHGDRADTMMRMLQIGDPVADAVIAEFDELGGAARAALRQGLAEGRASVPDAPAAVSALLAEAETAPEWASPALLADGDLVTLAVPLPWSSLALTAGSLTHTYMSPSMARLLTRTGRLTTMTPRRLIETRLWRSATILPGGLHRGAPGYQQTVQVRLLHARVRMSALAQGWESDRWGVPINQSDLIRTWLDFTAVPFAMLELVGYRLSEQEQARLYRYWWHVGRLMGVDERLFLGIGNHEQAGELLDLLDATSGRPDENSRALVDSTLDVAAANWSTLPGSPIDRPAWRALLDVLLRAYHGDAAADALGIGPSPLSAALPLIAASEARARRYQRLAPAALREAEAEGVALFSGVAASVAGDTAYQEHLAGL